MAKRNSKNVEPTVETSVETTTPTVKAEKKAKTPTAKVVKASKYRGRKTGMRVMEFQDHTLAVNDEKKNRRTDEELRDIWRAEFPDAVAFTLDHVRGVRSLYNAGKHTKMSEVPETPSRPYIVRDGKRVVSEYSRTPKAKTAKAKKTEAKATATPTVKVRRRVAKDAEPVARAS